MPRRTLLLAPLLVALLSLQALGNGRCWDDLEFTFARGGRLLSAGLTGDLLAEASPGHGPSGYYRPVAVASLATTEALFPGATAHHALSVALHALATGLLALLLSRRLGAGWPALLAAMLWGLHPANLEPVAWISGRYDLLSGLLAVSLLLVSRAASAARAGGGSRAADAARTFGLGLLFLCGLLSKEGFVALALVLLVDDFAAAGRSVTAGTGGETAAIAAGGPRRVAAQSWLRWLAVAGALGTWLALRRLFSIASISLPPVADLPRDLLSGLAIFLLRAFAPWPPSVSHPYAPSWTLAAAGALALAALLLLAWRRPSLATPVALLLAPLVPAGLAAARLGEAPERYLYLPSLGLAWLAGAGLQAAWKRAGLARAAGAGAAALLIAAGGLGWMVRLPDWRSDATLFGAALRVDPGDALANLALGSLAAREGRLEEAGQRLEAALQRDPASVRALATLAWVDLRRGEAGAAAARARQAIALAPAYPLPRLHLSGALHLSGDHAGELAAAEAALALSPAYREARLTRSLARCEVTPDPACEADLEAMEREGRLTGVDRLVALAEAALRRRDPGLARARVERLVAAAPADPRSRLLLAALARLEGGAGSRGPPKR